MSHGEEFLVPINLLLIASSVVIWGISLPLWTTLAIAVPFALVLAAMLTDKYVGMQIVMLIAPAFLFASISIGSRYKEAIAAQADSWVGYLLLEFVVKIVVLPLLVFAMLMLLAGVFFVWEWMRGR